MSVLIEPYAHDDAPVVGAKKVWFLIDGFWEHKGWLMPEVPWPEDYMNQTVGELKKRTEP